MTELELVITFILGSFITWSLVVRYQTINSYSFVKNARITVFLFTSFAVGLSMVNVEQSIKIADLLAHHPVFKVFLFASPALLPIILRVLQGYTFSSSCTLNADVILIPLVMFFTLKFFLTPTNNDVFLTLYFIAFAMALGFIYSVLGGIIASLNIVLMIAGIFNYSILTINLDSLFQLLEQIGIASPLFKWGIVIASTFIGLSVSLTQWLKDAPR